MGRESVVGGGGDRRASNGPVRSDTPTDRRPSTWVHPAWLPRKRTPAEEAYLAVAQRWLDAVFGNRK